MLPSIFYRSGLQNGGSDLPTPTLGKENSRQSRINQRAQLELATQRETFRGSMTIANRFRSEQKTLNSMVHTT
jgi:hypothetical protein